MKNFDVIKDLAEFEKNLEVRFCNPFDDNSSFHIDGVCDDCEDDKEALYLYTYDEFKQKLYAMIIFDENGEMMIYRISFNKSEIEYIVENIKSKGLNYESDILIGECELDLLKAYKASDFKLLERHYIKLKSDEPYREWKIEFFE